MTTPSFYRFTTFPPLPVGNEIRKFRPNLLPPWHSGNVSYILSQRRSCTNAQTGVSRKLELPSESKARLLTLNSRTAANVVNGNEKILGSIRSYSSMYAIRQNETNGTPARGGTLRQMFFYFFLFFVFGENDTVSLRSEQLGALEISFTRSLEYYS
jgi:hypothetical protein